MPRRTTVMPTTPLGKALESHRERKGLTRRAAYEAANTSDMQWMRLLTENRRFEPGLIMRAAEAVGMTVAEAFEAAGIVIVPDHSRVIRASQLEELLQAS